MKQLISLLIPFLLTSCAWLDDSNESKLKGERMPILASAPTEAVMDSAKTSMRLPVAVPAKSWNYSHLVANDLPENIAIEPNKIKIGAKVAKITKRDKIFAGPVLANGNVYFAECRGIVSYNKIDGEQADHKPHSIDLGYGFASDKECLTTGLTIAANRLFVTKGDQNLAAIDLATNSILWHFEAPGVLDNPVAVAGNDVVLLTHDSTLMLLDAATAQPKWQEKMAAEDVGVLGQAMPVVKNDLILVPYNSGLIFAYSLKTGDVLWSANLAYARFGKSSLNFSDSNATPVVRDGIAYVANNSGAVFAIDARNGNLLWHAPIEMPQSLWVAGNRVFVRTLEHKLVALERDNGSKQWETDLLTHANIDGKKKKQPQMSMFGPLLVNNQLLITTSSGVLMQIDPANGEVKQIEQVYPSNAAPIIDGNHLYQFTDDGELQPIEF